MPRPAGARALSLVAEADGLLDDATAVQA